MKIYKFLVILFLFVSFAGNSQTHQEEILAFQKELNDDYLDEKESPLKEEERLAFKGHTFFPINEKFKVMANFVRAENEVPFEMKTSSDRLPIYEKYGYLTFEIDGKSYQLSLFQNHKLRDNETYKDYLFLPFNDLTNGEETYGGGRFIDMRIPKSNQMVLDFNKAYNPYCAYTMGYSCPIPPRENNLNVEILAGITLKSSDK